METKEKLTEQLMGAVNDGESVLCVFAKEEEVKLDFNGNMASMSEGLNHYIANNANKLIDGKIARAIIFAVGYAAGHDSQILEMLHTAIELGKKAAAASDDSFSPEDSHCLACKSYKSCLDKYVKRQLAQSEKLSADQNKKDQQ